MIIDTATELIITIEEYSKLISIKQLAESLLKDVHMDKDYLREWLDEAVKDYNRYIKQYDSIINEIKGFVLKDVGGKDK